MGSFDGVTRTRFRGFGMSAQVRTQMGICLRDVNDQMPESADARVLSLSPRCENRPRILQARGRLLCAAFFRIYSLADLLGPARRGSSVTY